MRMRWFAECGATKSSGKRFLHSPWSNLRSAECLLITSIHGPIVGTKEEASIRISLCGPQGSRSPITQNQRHFQPRYSYGNQWNDPDAFTWVVSIAIWGGTGGGPHCCGPFPCGGCARAIYFARLKPNPWYCTHTKNDSAEVEEMNWPMRPNKEAEYS
jgi:hypothetical protein